jgi:hypothetical protein
MTILSTIQQVLVLLIALSGILWGLFKFYLKSYKVDIKTEADADLVKLKKEIKDERKEDTKEIEKKIIEIESDLVKLKKEIKDERKEDIKDFDVKINKSCNIELCDARIKNKVDGEFQLLKRDIAELKGLLLDQKIVINNQQEAILAIQLSLTELKPRVESLERRFDKLETRVDNATK